MLNLRGKIVNFALQKLNCMMKLRILPILLAVAACVPPAMRAENIIDIEGADATTIGIYIKDLATGDEIVDHNSSLAMTPASVTKALTTATALATLGPDFRFTTTVEFDGRRVASDGRWSGNLIINASADPTIGSSEFKISEAFTDSIIAGLKRLGISSINGDIIIREQLADAGPCPTWEVEDIAWPYGAGLFGFNYNGNTVRMYPGRNNSVPPSELNAQTFTSERTDVLRGVGSNDIKIWTTAKNRNNKAWNVSVTVPDPASVYVHVLTKRLEEAGIRLNVRKSASGTRTPVYTHRSPALKDICRNLMKRSDNLFAEGMLRALKSGESRAECIKYEKKFWGEQGISTRFTVINDGSGLTRANRMSPRFLADILEWMARSPMAADYLDFFPVAGVDGTLKSFLSKTRLKGRLAMKTGSVSAVQTYAGYKLDAGGNPTQVVVSMVNGFFCSRSDLRKALETFLLDTFE